MYDFKLVKDGYQEFDKFVIDSPVGNFRQTSYWGKIKELSGWESKPYMLRKDGIISGTALLFVKKIPCTYSKIIYCCRGPVVEWEDKATCKALLSGLKKVVHELKGFVVRVDPEPALMKEEQESILLESGCLKVKERVSQWNRSLYTTRVSLGKSENELFCQMRRTHRQNIKKAYKMGVSICRERLSNDKDTFFHLMRGLEGKRNSLIHSKKYYNNIYETIVENNLGFFIKALINGKVISGLIIAVLKDKAWALYIANDYEYRNLMPNKVLLWEALRIANERGCRFIDLGSTQGTSTFNPKNDSLDLLKNAYRPEVIYYPGYYDITGPFYNLFSILERKVFPFALKEYYRTQRFLSLLSIKKNEHKNKNTERQ